MQSSYMEMKPSADAMVLDVEALPNKKDERDSPVNKTK